mgnify:CR=1 FL=1
MNFSNTPDQMALDLFQLICWNNRVKVKTLAVRFAGVLAVELIAHVEQ